MKKILLIGLPIVLLAAGAAVYFLVLNKSEPPPAEGEEVAEESAGPPGLVSMETFLVNISDETGDRFAKVELRLSVVPQKTATAITSDELLVAKMRDRVLTLLSGKSYGELSTPIGKEGFRREIKSRLAPLIEEGEIQEVLFQDFIVQ